MDGNDSPSSVHEKLHEEDCCIYAWSRGGGIRIEEGAAENTHYDYGETASENLAAVADGGTPDYRANIEHNNHACNFGG